MVASTGTQADTEPMVTDSGFGPRPMDFVEFCVSSWKVNVSDVDIEHYPNGIILLQTGLSSDLKEQVIHAVPVLNDRMSATAEVMEQASRVQTLGEAREFLYRFYLRERTEAVMKHSRAVLESDSGLQVDGSSIVHTTRDGVMNVIDLELLLNQQIDRRITERLQTFASNIMTNVNYY